MGVILALQLISKERGAHVVSVKLNNQAVVQVLNGNKARSGSSLINTIHLLCDRLSADERQHPLKITFTWISGHDGVQGNECADTKAKKAATKDSSPRSALPAKLHVQELPYSTTAVWGTYDIELMEHWRSRWVASPR